MKFGIISVLFLSIFVFSACERASVYEASGKVSDLIVPQNFDWEMSRDVVFSISSPVETGVSIYADAACQKLLATLPASLEETSYNLNVEKNTDKLYVQYTKANGELSVLPVAILSTRSQGAVVKLPEDAGALKGSTDPAIYYPSNGWGTLLFEDMWPEKGDYDLNDLSALYKIQLEDLTKDNKKAQAILIGVRLNGLGGELPYQLCLQIDDLHSKDIDEVVQMGGDENVYEWENPGESEPAIFSFDWKDKRGSRGGIYYNTEKNYPVDPAELDKGMVYFVIYLDKPIVVKQLQHTSFNFFLRKDDGIEIHLRGYAPTKAFRQKYQEILQENLNLSRSIYYCTTDNFVWGLKVAKGIDHAVEKTDFIKAYTDFGKWAQSGGKDFTDWYNNKVPENCMKVN